MLLGANGLCGTSLLPLLEKLHSDCEVIGVDPCPEAQPPIIHAEVKEDQLWHILKSFGMGKGDILIDLVPSLCKLDVMQAADNAGVSCINATSCEHNRGTTGIVDLVDKSLLLGRYNWQVPHIPDSGMNPGNVNAMLAKMVEDAEENPVDITQWELDSTVPFNWDGRGFATWSPDELSSEYCDESTFEVDGKKLVYLDGPPIDNIVEMLDGNPGAICQHEELILWGWRYGCKARYLYGWRRDTMEAIKQHISEGLELELCRKLKGKCPTGGDRISLAVQFTNYTRHGSIYMPNESDEVPIGSNATSYLVACGISTAVQMLKEGCEAGICWPDDFAGRWVDFIKDNHLCEVEFSDSPIIKNDSAVAEKLELVEETE